jgi:hypothetical protein
MPNFVSKIPFSMSYFFVRILFRDYFKSDASLGVRNSYARNYFEPLYSDIDLSVLTSRKQKNVVVTFLNSLQKQRRWNLALGEVNIYFQEDIDLLIKYCNYFEMQRDPLLLAHTKFVRYPTVAEKIIFLSKMLEADNKALEMRPETRTRKWAHHFELVFGFPLKKRSLSKNDLMTELARYLQLPSTAWSESLQYYLTRRDQLPTLTHAELENLLKENPWWWSCYANKFCFLKLNCELSPLQWRCLVATLQWELWGLFTQQLQLPKESLDLHKDHLASFIKNILEGSSLDSSLRSDLENLIISFSHLPVS